MLGLYVPDASLSSGKMGGGGNGNKEKKKMEGAIVLL